MKKIIIIAVLGLIFSACTQAQNLPKATVVLSANPPKS